MRRQEVCVNPKGKAKVAYPTRAAAEKAARRGGHPVKVYKCFHHGNHYCLTSHEVNSGKAPLSAAKLRRQLADRAALIASQQRRMTLVDEQLAKQQEKIRKLNERAEKDHQAEVDAIRVMVDRAFSKRAASQ
jgi:hypothetical protein